MRIVLGLIALASVAGCMTPGPAVPSGVAAVSWGAVGSIHGGGYTTIFPDDRYVVTVIRPDGQTRETTVQAPAGSFDALLRQVSADLATLPPVSPVAPCADFGTIFVQLQDTVGAPLARSEALCRDERLRSTLDRAGNTLARRMDEG